MIRLTVLSVVGVLAVGACADHMNDGSRHMDEALGEAQDETQFHANRCEASSTMTEVSYELVRHEQAMADVMGHLDRAMDMMHGAHCGSSGMDRTMETVSTMRTAMRAHREKMLAASDVSSARDECVRHRKEMMNLCEEGRAENGGTSCM